MTAFLLRSAALVALVLLPVAPARALVNPCEFAADGTACSSSCATGGRCEAGACVGGISVPDGVRCASGDPCSADDRCVAGLCVAGPVFAVCPTSRCGEAPACQPDEGCVYTVVCPPPDGPDAGDSDAGEADSGGADAGEADAGAADAGQADAGSGGGSADAGPPDAGAPDVTEGTWSDVQGSGCSCGTGSFAWPLALVAAHGARRRRRPLGTP